MHLILVTATLTRQHFCSSLLEDFPWARTSVDLFACFNFSVIIHKHSISDARSLTFQFNLVYTLQIPPYLVGDLMLGSCT